MMVLSDTFVSVEYSFIHNLNTYILIYIYIYIYIYNIYYSLYIIHYCELTIFNKPTDTVTEENKINKMYLKCIIKNALNISPSFGKVPRERKKVYICLTD